MDLQGKRYAQVKDRLVQFRNENPNGLIETTPTIMEDGKIMFKTRIVKDKSDVNSAEATGHALGNNSKSKDFEKLETISVGRALALLGYATDGEIASSDEMEEFHAFKDEKIEKAIKTMQKVKTIDELKEIFTSLGGLMSDTRIITTKDEIKNKLNENNKAGSK